ncbi:CoxG family protein [Halosimplex pelagicum]|uniref:SRPBCC family protein n=1 Tax=Halosimplex pelagicum TaxID=869886 RepID=A0A7D5TUU8_9EURY|nr:SRPBCC family protein [Halosimplex pelagicum]QLH83572.1 SRPBCC family protein [Halosimplex pelagicum]
MTVRVERSFELPVDRERVWEFIADPGRRAGAISVVSDYTVHDDGSATWRLDLPIPVVNRTIAVETEDEERRSPEYVRFVGRSKVMKVVGEHELTETDEGTRLTNRFVVDGSLPGVERFFKRNLDEEMQNLEQALADDLGVEV